MFNVTYWSIHIVDSELVTVITFSLVLPPLARILARDQYHPILADNTFARLGARCSISACESNFISMNHYHTQRRWSNNSKRIHNIIHRDVSLQAPS